MTKENIIHILKSYRENKAKLKLKKKEWEKLETVWIDNRHAELEKGLTSSYGINSEIKSNNTISNKVESSIIESEMRREEALIKQEEIEKEIKELKNKVEEAEIMLNSLYYKEREIITAYYIDNREAEEIGRNLYWELYNRTCSAENIYRIVKRAIKKMIKL